jgi:hypothetical protein
MPLQRAWKLPHASCRCGAAANLSEASVSASASLEPAAEAASKPVAVKRLFLLRARNMPTEKNPRLSRPRRRAPLFRPGKGGCGTAILHSPGRAFRAINLKSGGTRLYENLHIKWEEYAIIHKLAAAQLTRSLRTSD